MALLKFTVLRLGFVLAFFLICVWLGLGLVLSAVIAAVLAWCVTYLFFRSMRDAAASTLQRRFRKGAPPVRSVGEQDDAAAEDGFTAETPVNADQKPRRY